MVEISISASVSAPLWKFLKHPSNASKKASYSKFQYNISVSDEIAVMTKNKTAISFGKKDQASRARKINVVPQILDQVTDQVIIDMGSTKTNILNKLKIIQIEGAISLPTPMAGTEYSGPEAAVCRRFRNHRCNHDQLEMRTCFMNADEHDVHTAYVSHISHLTSFALALTVLEKEKSQGRIFELAGSGFESPVRLAKSSPDMWTPIFKQNRENVLEVLEEHIKQLQSLHDSIASEDYDKLHKLIKRSNKIKRIIK
ncbi:prephenate dehydrogenase domain-containing protein [Ditylenchus destructor]|uniref:Prephenate dehydrogenase domain-containing protein n=1 Tax=Ditylenchus destructor TaxID=166010 RepID=A0AAD4QQX7_9BILA|nr:prephenate dehydrogenase domain-containing protein [Ditylenchus destructor]